MSATPATFTLYKVGDGSLAWSHNFPGQLVRGIGITPDLLYLGTMRGMVYAFSPETVNLNKLRFASRVLFSLSLQSS